MALQKNGFHVNLLQTLDAIMKKFLVFLVFCFSVHAMSKLAPVQNVGVRTLLYEDKRKSVPIAVECWYPTEQNGPFDEEIRNASLSKRKEKYPLILVSHGNRGDRRDICWLAESLVKKGFIVASVEHHGNCRSHYDPRLSLRFWERPRDISSALDHLLKDGTISNRIDRERVGFVGYSLGGMTGLALGGASPKNVKEVLVNEQKRYQEIEASELEAMNVEEAYQNLADERIKALLLICPAIFVYPPHSLKNIHVPVGLVASLHDEVLPHDEHAYQIMKHLVPAKLKLYREKVSHMAFGDPEHPDLAKIHEEVVTFAADFFDEQLTK